MQTAIKPGTHCGGRASALASVFLRLIGGLILFAAVMRGVQALGSPTSAPGLLSLPSIPAVTIAWEIFLGLWLISGALPKAARRIAIGCFSVFACYTLYEALAGKADCGCLGHRLFQSPCGVAVARWIAAPQREKLPDNYGGKATCRSTLGGRCPRIVLEYCCRNGGAA